MPQTFEIIDFMNYYLRNPLEFHYSWLTDVVMFDSGLEQRNQILEEPMRSWNLLWNGMLLSERDTLLSAYRQAQGGYDTFFLKDHISFSGIFFATSVKYSFVEASIASDYLAVSGYHADEFFVGQTVFVDAAGPNAGTWTVSSITYDSGTSRTRLWVSEDVGSSDVTGDLYFLGYQLTAYFTSGPQQWYEDIEYVVADTLIVLIDSVAQTVTVDYSESGGVVTFTTGSYPTEGEVVQCTFEFAFKVRFREDSLSLPKTSAALWEPDTIGFIEVK